MPLFRRRRREELGVGDDGMLRIIRREYHSLTFLLKGHPFAL